MSHMTQRISRFSHVAALAGLIVCAVIVPSASAQPYVVSVNGRVVPMNEPPVRVSGRIFVPMRPIFEALGATVVFDAGTINATSGDKRMQIKIGSTQAVVNGTATQLDAPPFLQGNTTMVPLRFVSESLGATVDFNESTGVIRIATVAPPVAETSTPVAGKTIPARSLIATTLRTPLDSRTSNTGDAVTLAVVAPYPNGARVLEGSTIYGRVIAVQRAGQGRNPTIELEVDRLRLAGGTTMIQIAGTIDKIAPPQGPNVNAGLAGAGAGMAAGNWIGKSVGTDVGGAAGAVTGYLISSNSRQDIGIPTGSSVGVRLTKDLYIPHT
jgi:hypothetical protein